MNSFPSQHRDGANVNPRYDGLLAPYAFQNQYSAPRTPNEPVDPNRTPFQRDRDRIIHSTAWRRLKGKMQVVPPNHGDHFRTRMTHTIEVAQVARDLARWLQLNEDLAEAIALGHDLGHPPFGHSGETALNECLQPFHKQFEHNVQSLRIVTKFEHRYATHAGLSLTNAVLEGLKKHEKVFYDEDGNAMYRPHLEANLVDISDEIAYLSADLEDGLRGGFFTWNDLRQIELVRTAQAQLPVAEKERRPSVVRIVIHLLLEDLVTQTQTNITDYTINSLAAAQQCETPILHFSPRVREGFFALKRFLFVHYYKAPQIAQWTAHGQTIIKDLFQHYMTNETAFQTIAHPTPEASRERIVADFIAGMTDAYATQIWTNQQNGVA